MDERLKKICKRMYKENGGRGVQVNFKKVVSAEDFMIGQRVLKARRDAGMTQGEMAKFIDVSAQQIQKYERGYNRISGYALFKLACLFKRPFAYYFEDIISLNKDDYEAMYDIVNSNHNLYVAMLIKHFLSVKDKAMQKCIYDLVKNISGLCRE